MVRRYVIIFAALLLFACGGPLDIRFGPHPTEDMQKYADKLKQLPPDDLALLTSYVTYCEMNELEGKNNPAIGKLVKEAMQDAKSWNKVQQAAAEELRQKQEATRLETGKQESERKLRLDRVNRSLVISFVKRTVFPPNPDTKRTDPIVKFDYDMENKGGKAILAIKGKSIYKDLFGKTIVEHPFISDKTIPIGGHITLTIAYRVPQVWREMTEFTQAEDGKFTFIFQPDAVSFEGGETLDVVPPKNAAPEGEATQPKPS